MFALFLIVGLTCLIFSFIGIKKFRIETTASKLTRLVLILLGLFLLYVGFLDAYSFLTDPSSYLDGIK